eukprot:scaffold285_cov330-Pavlova_lutheri.AAC.27
MGLPFPPCCRLARTSANFHTANPSCDSTSTNSKAWQNVSDSSRYVTSMGTSRNRSSASGTWTDRLAPGEDTSTEMSSGTACSWTARSILALNSLEKVSMSSIVGEPYLLSSRSSRTSTKACLGNTRSEYSRHCSSFGLRSGPSTSCTTDRIVFPQSSSPTSTCPCSVCPKASSRSHSTSSDARLRVFGDPSSPFFPFIGCLGYASDLLQCVEAVHLPVLAPATARSSAFMADLAPRVAFLDVPWSIRPRNPRVATGALGRGRDLDRRGRIPFSSALQHLLRRESIMNGKMFPSTNGVPVRFDRGSNPGFERDAFVRDFPGVTKFREEGIHPSVSNRFFRSRGMRPLPKERVPGFDKVGNPIDPPNERGGEAGTCRERSEARNHARRNGGMAARNGTDGDDARPQGRNWNERDRQSRQGRFPGRNQRRVPRTARETVARWRRRRGRDLGRVLATAGTRSQTARARRSSCAAPGRTQNRGPRAARSDHRTPRRSEPEALHAPSCLSGPWTLLGQPRSPRTRQTSLAR